MLKYVETDSSQMAFMFDDILDLGLAATTGAGFFVRRDANPLLNDYVKRNNLADYQTASVGGQNPVREVCELCMAALDNFNEVVALMILNIRNTLVREISWPLPFTGTTLGPSANLSSHKILITSRLRILSKYVGPFVNKWSN